MEVVTIAQALRLWANAFDFTSIHGTRFGDSVFLSSSVVKEQLEQFVGDSINDIECIHAITQARVALELQTLYDDQLLNGTSRHVAYFPHPPAAAQLRLAAGVMRVTTATRPLQGRRMAWSVASASRTPPSGPLARDSGPTTRSTSTSMESSLVER